MAIRVDQGGIPVPLTDDATEALGAATRVAAFRAAFRSESAFRDLYERALPRVYGYLASRCHGDVSLAEDLTQQAFADALRVRDTFDGRSDPITWLIGIARHKWLDHVRAEARDERRHMHLVVRELAMDDAERPWQEADDHALLQSALGRLPALQRAVLILHYADGLPVREVARELARSESATESLLTRARVALRAAWEEAIDD
jgi:RNA polymerase sigma-70 factor (ECF subfamily)